MAINKNLVIKEKFDWNFDDYVNVPLFVDQFIDTLKLEHIDKKEIENQIYYQVPTLPKSKT